MQPLRLHSRSTDNASAILVPRSADKSSAILEKAMHAMRVPFGEKRKGTAQKHMMQMLQRFPHLHAYANEYENSFALLRYLFVTICACTTR